MICLENSLLLFYNFSGWLQSIDSTTVPFASTGNPENAVLDLTTSIVHCWAIISDSFYGGPEIRYAHFAVLLLHSSRQISPSIWNEERISKAYAEKGFCCSSEWMKYTHWEHTLEAPNRETHPQDLDGQKLISRNQRPTIHKQYINTNQGHKELVKKSIWTWINRKIKYFKEY